MTIDSTNVFNSINNLNLSELSENEIKVVLNTLISENLQLKSQNEKLLQQNSQNSETINVLNLDIELFSSVIKETTNSILIFNASGQLEWVNIAFEKLTNYSKNEILAGNHQLIIPELINGELSPVLKAGLTENTTLEYETSLRKQKKIIYLKATLTIFKNQNNQVKNYAIIYTDITDLQETKFELLKQKSVISNEKRIISENQQKLTSKYNKLQSEKLTADKEYFDLIQNLAIGIIRTTPDNPGKFIFANSYALNLFGFSSLSDLKKLNVSDLYAIKSDREYIFNEITKKGKIADYHLLLKHKNIERWCKLSLNAHKTQSNEIIWIDGIIEDVTTIKDTTELLKAERDHSFKMINESPLIVCGLTPDGTTNFINPAAERILGYSKNEIMGKNWWLTFYPDNEFKQVTKRFQDAKSRQIQNYAMVVTTKSGEKRSISWNSIHRKNSTNETTEIISFGVDVTEQIKAQEELNKSENLLNKIFNVSSEALRLLDSEKKIIKVNESYAKIYQKTADEFIGMPCNAYLNCGKCNSDFCYQNEHIIVGKTYETDIALETPSGDDKYYILTTTPFNYTDNSIALLQSFKDITERRKLEIVILENEEKYRTLFDSADEGIFTILSNIIIDCNKKAGQMLGLEKSKIIGNNINHFTPEFQLNNETSKNYLNAFFNKALSGQAQHFECLMVNADNNLFYAEFTINQLELNNQLYLQVIWSDITERKETEKFLSDYRNNLEKLVTERSEELIIANKQLYDKNHEISLQRDLLQKNNLELLKLSLVAEKTTNAISIYNANFKIEWINTSYTKLYGHTLDYLIDLDNLDNFNIFTYLNNQQKEQLTLALKNYEAYTTEKKVVLNEKNTKWFQTTFTPVINEDAVISKLIVIDSDITTLKVVQENLNQINKDITDSIKYASKIQTALLPPSEYLNMLLPEHFVLYRPKDIISGDFYWITEKNNLIYLAVGDCTGHGVPGALLSMLGITLLNEIVNSNLISGTAELLNIYKAELKKALRQYSKYQETSDGINIGVCIIDKQNSSLKYSGAFHPLIKINNTIPIKYQADKMPIGSYYTDQNSFNQTSIQFSPEDIFYLFSDGFQDQFGGSQMQKLRSNRFYKLLEKISSMPLIEQKNYLDQYLNNWISEANNNNYDNFQVDDILVLGFKCQF